MFRLILAAINSLVALAWAGVAGAYFALGETGKGWLCAVITLGWVVCAAAWVLIQVGEERHERRMADLRRGLEARRGMWS